MRFLSALMIVIAMSGCRYGIPDPRAIATISENTEPGNTCINPGKKVGDRIQHLETGQLGTIMQLYGTSPRCMDKDHPILADVLY